MPTPKDGLTLAGLARILRDHMDGTALQFAEVRKEFSQVGVRFAEVGSRIDDLRREIADVAGMVRDLSQVMLRQMDDIAEHRRQIQQIYSRMEQHDARFEAMTGEIREMRLDIRRILDAMEGRGGDGGGRQP